MFKLGDKVILVSQEGTTFLRNIAIGDVGEVVDACNGKYKWSVRFPSYKLGYVTIEVTDEGSYLYHDVINVIPAPVPVTEEIEIYKAKIKELRRQAKLIHKEKLGYIERLKALEGGLKDDKG